jgi:hypothetical protein
MKRIIKKLIFVILGSLCLLGGAFAANIEITDTQARNLLLGDSWVYQDSPNSNYGTDNELYVQVRTNVAMRSYVNFDLDRESINAQDVANATLNMYQYTSASTSSSYTIEFYYCSSDFTESTITWNNQASQVTGCDVSPFGTYLMNEGNGWKTFDITDEIQSNLEQSFTIKVISNIEQSGSTARNVRLSSSEYATTSLRPRLNIETFGTPDLNLNYSSFYNTNNISINLTNEGGDLTNMSYSLDNGTLTSICNNCNSTTLNLTGLSEGSHSILFVSEDENGQLNSTASFTVDTGAPSITNNNSLEINSYVFPLNFSCDDINIDACIIEFEDENKTYTDLNKTFTTNGNHTYTIHATDLAGNYWNETSSVFVNPEIEILFFDENSGQIYNFTLENIAYENSSNIKIYDYGLGNFTLEFQRLGYVKKNITLEFTNISGLSSQYNISFAKIVINLYDRETSAAINDSYSVQISGPSGISEEGTGEIIIQDSQLLSGDYSIIVNSDGYSNGFKSFSYDNQKLLDLDFYLFKNSTDIKNIYVYVQSSFVNSEDGVVVVLEEYDTATQKFKAVSEATTSNSRVRFEVELGIKIYRVCAYGDSVISCLKPDRVFYLEDEEFTIDLRDNLIIDSINLKDYVYSISNTTENNLTTVNFNFRDKKAQVQSFCMDVYYLSGIKYLLLSENCVDDYQGSIERNINSNDTVLKVVTYAITQNNEVVPLEEKVFNQNQDFQEEIENTNLFFIILVFLILVVIGLGFITSPILIPFGFIGLILILNQLIPKVDNGLVIAIVVINLIVGYFLYKNE